MPKYRKDVERLFSYMSKLEKLYPGAFTEGHDDSLFVRVGKALQNIPKVHNINEGYYSVRYGSEETDLDIEIRNTVLVNGQAESFSERINKIFIDVRTKVNELKGKGLSRNKNINYHTDAFLDHVDDFCNMVINDVHAEKFYYANPEFAQTDQIYFNLVEGNGEEFNNDLTEEGKDFVIYDVGKQMNALWKNMEDISKKHKDGILGYNGEKNFKNLLCLK